jgi:hypothetical protein
MIARRRTLVAFGSAAVAAGVSGTGAQSSTPPASDALLLQLDASRASAVQWLSLSCLDEDRDFPTEEARAIAVAAREAADEALDSVIRQMARTPAEGLTGLAIKAAQLCRALKDGASIEDHALRASLQADIARLVPGVVT